MYRDKCDSLETELDSVKQSWKKQENEHLERICTLREMAHDSECKENEDKKEDHPLQLDIKIKLLTNQVKQLQTYEQLFHDEKQKVEQIELKFLSSEKSCKDLKSEVMSTFSGVS